MGGDRAITRPAQQLSGWLYLCWFRAMRRVLRQSSRLSTAYVIDLRGKDSAARNSK